MAAPVPPVVAVPEAKLYCTEEARLVEPVLVTVKVMVPAASLTVTSLMAKLGRSSSRLVASVTGVEPVGLALVNLVPVPSSTMVAVPVAARAAPLV